MADLRVSVVGAGIIGLAVAYQLTKARISVTVLDRDPEGDRTSNGNAGGIAVTEVFPAGSPGLWRRALGYLTDPLGPLAIRPRHALSLIPWLTRFAAASSSAEVERISCALSALNRRTYEDLLPLLDDCHIRNQLHPNGALSVYETEAGYARDAAEWARKRALGIEVQELSGKEARGLESALGPQVHRAVLTPQWSHIDDPRKLLAALRDWLLLNGVRVLAREVCGIAPGTTSPISLQVKGGSPIAADVVVIAAGAWSESLTSRIGDRVLLESERGYNTTLPEPGVTIRRELIFAERKFVATPLSCGLRIGGAAEFGGLTAAPNFQRSRALLELAQRYLPDLKTGGGTYWAGHRPATPDSLPVIGPSPRLPHVIYAFGHGHLGLTQAATTGRLVCDLITHRKPVLDLSPYSIQRFSKSKEVRDATTQLFLH